MNLQKQSNLPCEEKEKEHARLDPLLLRRQHKVEVQSRISQIAIVLHHSASKSRGGRHDRRWKERKEAKNAFDIIL
jgi:hypothetical protein